MEHIKENTQCQSLASTQTCANKKHVNCIHSTEVTAKSKSLATPEPSSDGLSLPFESGAWTALWGDSHLGHNEKARPGDPPGAHLQWEDLHSDKVIHELSLPNAAKAASSLDLQQL